MDFTITLTVIISVIAFVSPIFVAIINNAHNTKIRKMELQNQLEQKQFDTYYSDKEKAYAAFSNIAGEFIFNNAYADAYQKLSSSIYQVMLLCDENTKPLLNDFVDHFNSHCSTDDWKKIYLFKLSSLTNALNKELYSTARAISELYTPKRQSILKWHKSHK